MPLLPGAARPAAAVGAAVCVAITAGLGLWLTDRSTRDPLDVSVDARLVSGLGAFHGPMTALAWLGQPLPVTGMAAVLALGCLLRRRYRLAALAVIAVPAAAIITERLLKPLIDQTSVDLSFPSGHTTGTFALTAVLWVLLVGCPGVSRGLRLLLALAAFLIAAADGIAVVALGLHAFTDTVGGAAVGTGTVLLTAVLLDLTCAAVIQLSDRARSAGARGSAVGP